MGRMRENLVPVIDAAYRFDRPEGPWLAGVLEAVHPFVDQGFGSWAFFFDASSFQHGSLEYRSPTAIGLPPNWTAGLQATLDVSTRESRAMAKLMFGAPCHTMSALLRRRARVLQSTQRTIGRPGVYDSIGVTARDTSGEIVFIGAHAGKVFDLDARQSARLGRIAAHIATANRLRRSLHPSGVSPAGRLEARAEAMFGRRGRVVHAEGRASANTALDTLRRAAIAIEHAVESFIPHQPDEVLAAWEALVRGRWSLVASFDDGGRRILLAEPNEPGAPLFNSGLTKRERQIGGYLLLGHSNKLIAYEVGLTEGAVSNAVSRLKSKLRARTHVELLRILARFAKASAR